jgi:hypothetical protein
MTDYTDLLAKAKAKAAKEARRAYELANAENSPDVQEAVAEAKAINLDNHNIGQVAYRAAIEEAAKVAENYEWSYDEEEIAMTNIAAAIRALARNKEPTT